MLYLVVLLKLLVYNTTTVEICTYKNKIKHMNQSKHVILGSNGIVGQEVYASLKTSSNDIRLVSRSDRNNQQVHKADLTNLQQTIQAVKGYDIVYLTVGVTYDTDLWMKYWPVIIDNVIDATLEANARLVFYDNVYMYGKVDGWMTEETPFNPISKKGEVRAKAAQKILDAMAQQNLTALIARTPDFYGYSDQSIPNLLVFDRISKNEHPLMLLTADTKHSITYTKDIGASIVLLAQDEQHFNQTWHLPTDSHVPTAGEFVQMALEAFGKNITAQALSRENLLRIGETDPIFRAYYEMLYQNEFDFLFSSAKYEKAFQRFATPYRTGVKELAAKYIKG